MQKYRFLMWFFLGLTFACAPLPPPESFPPNFPPGIMQEANPALTLEKVQQHPETYKGQVILLGGDIVSVEATPQGPLLLEVRQRPLDSQGMPIMNAPSGGQFWVQYEGPNREDFRIWRRLAIIGEILGVRRQKLAGISFPIILIKAKAVRLWPGPGEKKLHPQIYYPWEVTPRGTPRGRF
jgi:starvation-inducible outer membrane lipoprotein